MHPSVAIDGVKTGRIYPVTVPRTGLVEANKHRISRVRQPQFITIDGVVPSLSHDPLRGPLPRLDPGRDRNSVRYIQCQVICHRHMTCSRETQRGTNDTCRPIHRTRQGPVITITRLIEYRNSGRFIKIPSPGTGRHRNRTVQVFLKVGHTISVRIAIRISRI